MEEKISEVLKCKRDKFQVEIRKQKNECILSNKRSTELFKLEQEVSSQDMQNGSLVESQEIAIENKILPEFSEDILALRKKIEKSCLDLDEAIKQNDIDLVIEFLGDLRKPISTHKPHYPLDLLNKHQIITKIIIFTNEYLRIREDLSYESLWFFCNLLCVSNDHEALINAGLLKIIRDIIFSHEFNRRIICQAAWCLANLTGHSCELRNQAINNGIIDLTENMLDFKYIQATEFDETITWLVSNVVRGRPYPEYDSVKHFYKLVERFLFSKSGDCLSETCWVYVSLSDNCINAKKIEKLSDFFECSIAIKKLINLGIYSNDLKIKYPAFRAVINLSYVEDASLLRGLVRDSIYSLILAGFDNREVKIRKAACVILVNLNSGGPEMIEYFYNHNANLLNHVKSLIFQDEFQISKECMIALCNLTHKATTEQLIRFKEIVLDILMQKFAVFKDESDFVTQFLDALDALFQEGNKVTQTSNEMEQNPFVIYFLQRGGSSILEYLQQSQNEKIYKKTISIVEENFKTDESIL